MATGYDQLIGGLLGGTGFGRTPNDIALQNLQLQGGLQGVRLNEMQLTAAQRKAQQAKQYEDDVATFLRDPTPGGIMALTAKYPEQGEALKKGWDIKDAAQRTADLGWFGSVNALLANKKTDRAAEVIRARRDAEKNAGRDTSELDEMLEGLQSGDPQTIKAIQGTVQAHIWAADPEKFGANYKAQYGENAGPYTLVPGARRFDENNTQVAEAPFAPRPVTVGEGDTVVEYQPGGGDPASGGQFTGGWTPRRRNGGDNDDAAVDGKIAGAARFLGVDPNADISELSPRKIAEAMALSEGGAGSLADRNNNPGNIRGPGGEGGFRKFPTKEAGLNAAAELVARKLRNGQTTVRSMIEGLPTGGGSRVIAQGQPKRDDPPSGYRWTGDGNLEPIPGGPGDKAARGGTADPKQEGLLRREFNNLPEVKDFKTVRSAYQQTAALGGKKDPTAADDIALIFSYMRMLDPNSVVREGEFATAQQATGVPDQVLNLYNRALSGNRLNAVQRRDMIGAAEVVYRQRRNAYNASAVRYRDIASEYGFNPDRIGLVAAQRVKSVREGEALPNGTPYRVGNKTYLSGEGPTGASQPDRDALKRKYGLK